MIKQGYLLLRGSRFESLYGETSAVEVSNANMTIEDSSFKNSEATKGSALALNCNEQKMNCDFSISDTIFENLTASDFGGAIYYSSYPPEINNCSF